MHERAWPAPPRVRLVACWVGCAHIPPTRLAWHPLPQQVQALSWRAHFGSFDPAPGDPAYRSCPARLRSCRQCPSAPVSSGKIPIFRFATTPVAGRRRPNLCPTWAPSFATWLASALAVSFDSPRQVVERLAKTPPLPQNARSPPRFPLDPLNLRARPHVQVLEVRRLACAAYFAGWADCGCRWPEGGGYCAYFLVRRIAVHAVVCGPLRSAGLWQSRDIWACSCGRKGGGVTALCTEAGML